MNGSANSLLDKEEHPLQLGESFERRPKASFHTIRCERLPRGRPFLPARLPSPAAPLPLPRPPRCSPRPLRSAIARGLRPRSAPFVPASLLPPYRPSPSFPPLPFFLLPLQHPSSPFRSLGARLSTSVFPTEGSSPGRGRGRWMLVGRRFERGRPRRRNSFRKFVVNRLEA